MKIALRLSYLGTDFCGYQVQPGLPTVQSALNEATKGLFGVPCDITGCSRTDSGVHANDFCVAVTERGKGCLITAVPLEKIPIALNVRLPLGIAVRSAEWVEESFHPRYDVVLKEYVYLIRDSKIRDPFTEGRVYSFSRSISDEGVERMNRAASLLCGKHDFSSYMASGSKVESTVRDMKYASVCRDGDVVKITLAADGFLYNMVRIIAGTLIDVGEGRKDPCDIPKITNAHDRSLAGATLPACGLYLNKVVY
jgi:tRNA pseudouridine38-40 synthase